LDKKKAAEKGATRVFLRTRKSYRGGRRRERGEKEAMKRGAPLRKHGFGLTETCAAGEDGEGAGKKGGRDHELSKGGTDRKKRKTWFLRKNNSKKRKLEKLKK